jgi:hypothetical protein
MSRMGWDWDTRMKDFGTIEERRGEEVRVGCLEWFFEAEMK